MNNNNNNNNNNNPRGALPASTRLASPYGGPVNTGKPGIHQPIPVLGSPNPRIAPYVVGTLHVHGAPAYGGDAQAEVRM